MFKQVLEQYLIDHPDCFIKSEADLTTNKLFKTVVTISLYHMGTLLFRVRSKSKQENNFEDCHESACKSVVYKLMNHIFG